MSLQPLDVVTSILSNPKSLDHVRPLVADDFTYVSLNYGDADLVKTFVDVENFWRVNSFSIEAAFGQDEHVALFGRFTYTSTVLEKQVTSPFAVYAKVVDGRCTYMQFMEDTFATGASFRSGGAWTFRSDPNGGEVTV
jgi:hypothetical protein